MTIRQRLAGQDPANTEWQRDLSISHDRIGDVQETQGDLDGASSAYQSSLTIRQRLAQQDPTNTEWQRDLSISHERLGNVRRAQGDLAGALAVYQTSLAIRQRLVQQDPANAQWQRDLTLSHQWIGHVREAQGDLPGALAAYQASLTIAERLARQDPANAEWQRDLAFSHEKIGTVRQAQGDLPGALAAYQDTLAIRERLARQDPANAEWQRDLSFNYERLVEVCVTQGNTQAALIYQRQLVEQRRQLANPPDLANALVALASLENDAGHTRTALDRVAEALKIARDLHAQQSNDDSRRLLAEVLGGQSFFLLFDRQFQAATAAAEEALALDPNLLWIATNQVHGYLLSGQFEKAEAIYRQHARDKLNDQQTFAEAVLDDFAKLRQRGIDHPDMKKIETLLRAEERPPR